MVNIPASFAPEQGTTNKTVQFKSLFLLLVYCVVICVQIIPRLNTFFSLLLIVDSCV